MKGTRKILLVLATVLLLTTVLGIFVFAENPEPQAVTDSREDRVDDTFEVYDIATGDTVTNTTAANLRSEISRISQISYERDENNNYKFDENGDYIMKITYNDGEEGKIITLLDDFVFTTSYFSAGDVDRSGKLTRPINLYIDLNGYDLIFNYSNNTDTGTKQTNSGYTFIEIGSNVNLHVYSSKPGGTLANVRKTTEGQIGYYTIFNLRYNRASLILGEQTPKAVRVNELQADETYYDKTGTVTCSGDNLTAYGSLVTTYYGSSTAGFHLEDITIDINGGTYYGDNTGRDALIMHEGDSAMNIKNATFIAPNERPVYAATSRLNNAGNKATFDNCLFYANTLIYSAHKNADIVFNNCRIACNKLIENVNSETKLPDYTSSAFSSGLTPNTTKKTVKTNISEILSINIPTFNFNSDRTINQANPYTMTSSTALATLALQLVDSGDFANITWVGLDGRSISEEWAKGDNIYPTPAIATPAATDICKYSYAPQILPTSSGDVSYTLTRSANFSIKANLTLYTDFIYNIYIPKDIADSEDFNHVKIDGITVSIPEETENINGAEYYHIENPISVVFGDSPFTLVLNLNDGSGEAFDALYTLSIPDYISKVLAGNYTDKQKDMVRATHTYIKAARNYFAQSSASLPYPIEDNSDLSELTHQAGTPSGTPSDAVKDVLYGATISLEGEIKFRFYAYSTADLVFVYNVNTAKTVDKPEPGEWTSFEYYPDEESIITLYYYEIMVKARDLRDDIKIYLGTEEKDAPDASFSLSNYAYYANNEANNISKRDLLTKLIDALYNYSYAASSYLHGTGTPDVDLVIAGAPVTADTHYILASGENELSSAEALRDAIFARTGELLTISDTELTGKNAIIISIDTPVTEYDFRAMVYDSTLTLSCGYKSFINSAMSSFINKYFSTASTDIELNNGFIDMSYTDRIYYSDFGALGNGKASKDVDYKAIYDAHNLANHTERHTVCADKDASYYIDDAKINGTAGTTIVIKTGVDWGNAVFTIDDTGLSPLNSDDKAIYSKHIFEVDSKYDNYDITDKEELARISSQIKIQPGTKVIDLGLDYPAMLVPYDSSHKVYRRKGYNGSWAGADMHEIIVVDKDGNVSKDTPIMFSYTSFTKITVIRLDIEPIVIEGGVFDSIASDQNKVYYKKLIADESGNAILDNNGNEQYENIKLTSANIESYKENIADWTVTDPYFNRGISVKRSFTTIKGLEHKISNEISFAEQKKGILGHSYNGFFYANFATDVTYDNCIMQARRSYNETPVVGSGGTPGTYDINASEVNNLVYKNCSQSNFWVTTDDDVIKGVPEGTAGAKLSMAKLPLTSLTTGSSSESQMHWGVGGSNYCKNLQYIDSTLSRLDAHSGMYNGKIINSTVNFISLTGTGEFIIENSRWFAQGDGTTPNSLIYLRNDYGSTWDGVIYMKDVKAYPYIDEATQKPTTTYLMMHSYNNWYYGYQSCFPNLWIDNLQYYNSVTGKAIAANELTLYLTSSGSSFYEPNLHMATTTKVQPQYPCVDNLTAVKDEYGNVTGYTAGADGYVDYTSTPYDKNNINTNGITGDDGDYTNLNPVRPPSYICISNNKANYNFIFPSNSEFFYNTKIINSTGVIIANKSDTPFIEFD